MLSFYQGRSVFVAVFCLLLFVLFVRNRSSPSSSFRLPHRSRSPLGSIGNDTLGFQKVFFINAPWRIDRKDSVSLATAHSRIKFDWVDGVNGSALHEKVYPPPGRYRTVLPEKRGQWRAHMNAIWEIVQYNVTTALILEDDADWDVRIRQQLSELSHGIRRLPALIKRSETHQHTPDEPNEQLSPTALVKASTITLSSASRLTIPPPNPYGLNWDLLWLGHCSTDLSPPSPHSPDRIMFPDDPTVPSPNELHDNFSTLYPPHTRLVHRTNTTRCTTAYAVTQSGARKLLYQYGIRDFSQPFDEAVSGWCDGTARGVSVEARGLCMGVSPPVFGEWDDGKEGVGELKRDDEAEGQGQGKAMKRRARVEWSVRDNLEVLVRGDEVEGWQQ
ncbi:glycosyltransferase family 25 protein [Amniculicola lignicola CBS 123094]|uniref:Glycosyltransferase family 25 protein n=1 Tax=Amniculicola lignicola CBS 123094 TaxID=1392246 RepID=A0A6A5WA56_9PLEO|nr:glycosyltransferase family 25 protein [Amniculicola lignicola CBS 123094]